MLTKIIILEKECKIITQDIFDQAHKELTEMRTMIAKERGRSRKEDKSETDIFYG